VVLFNTRTRRRYLDESGGGWEPGDEAALCHFVVSVLSGEIQPHCKSAEDTEEEGSPLASEVDDAATVLSGSPTSAGNAWALQTGVMEVVGKTFTAKVLEPVLAGTAEVLMLIYAPWCSHSLNFFPIWHALTEGDLYRGVPGERQLLFAQMDGTRNEHVNLPVVTRFPMILLVLPPLPSSATREQSAEPRVRYLSYEGTASLQGLREWVQHESSVAKAKQ